MIPAESRLSPRERECVELAVAGLDTKEIARQLGLSVETVKGYFKTAYAKLGVTRRSELIRLFRAPPSWGDLSGGVARPSSDRLSDEPPGRTAGPGVLQEATTAFIHEPLDRIRSAEPETANEDLTHSATYTIGGVLKIVLLALIALLIFMAVMDQAGKLGRPLLPYIRN